jgi:arsenical pump membrane protein
MLHLIFGISIFVLTLGVIMVRPYHISEALASAVGATLMLIGGYLLPGEAIQVLKGQWNIYGFFLGLMIISAIADQAGIFDILAAQTGRLAKGSARRLLLGVFLLGMLITAFLSNDATALILTPVVFAMVTRLRLPPLPFMFACTFIADTASFLLPVSNPINILFLDSFGGALGVYLQHMLLPSLFCIGFNIALFLFLFRADLRRKYQLKDLPSTKPPNRAFFNFTLVALGCIAVAFVLASSFQAPLSLVALGGAIALLIGGWHYGPLEWKRLRGEISWALFIFISGMFLVIRGIENLGLTNEFASGLMLLAGSNPLRSSLVVAISTALGANLINNVPMAIVATSTLHAMGVSSQAHPGLIYAAILGCDLGPNLTTVGSLATMLWLLILRRKGLDVSSVEYFKLGILVVPVMVAIGALLISLGK